MHSRAYMLLEKEWFKLQKEEIPWGIQAKPLNEEDMFTWEGTIKGLKDTMWEGGVFKLYLQFGEYYNGRPPRVFFHTIPFHPNVDPDTGQVCADFLDDLSCWKEFYSISYMLLSIQMLLANPVLENAVNSRAAKIFASSPSGFRQTVLDCVLASKRVEAIDGNYTDWKESSVCSVTCGGGTQTLTRTCTSPPPSNGGKDCSGLGPTTKDVSCNEQECPIDGDYTDWKETSACSVTCGGGTQILTRTCTNPPPSNGGKNCSGLGPAENIQECNTQDCPIDGGYTDWSEPSVCSVTCGGGTQTLTRTCTSPPPSNGGKDCSGLGPATKNVSCNEQECPPPCTAGLDVAILLDKSKSVKEPNLRKVITFLGELIDKFHPAPDADHFGLITFHNKANLVFNFTNSVYHDKNALLKKIASEPIKLELQTRTDLALVMALDKLFTEAGGDRPDKPNVMIILTDGKPTKPKGEKKFNFKDFAEGISKNFTEKRVNTVAVGIGPGVDQETLQLMANGGPVVQVEDFSKLEKMMETIKSSACSD